MQLRQRPLVAEGTQQPTEAHRRELMVCATRDRLLERESREVALLGAQREGAETLPDDRVALLNSCRAEQLLERLLVVAGGLLELAQILEGEEAQVEGRALCVGGRGGGGRPSLCQKWLREQLLVRGDCRGRSRDLQPERLLEEPLVLRLQGLKRRTRSTAHYGRLVAGRFGLIDGQP